MIEHSTVERLHECVRRESRSLLQYVREVPLWAGPSDRVLFDRIRELADVERLAVDDLATWLQKQRVGIMHLGPFPSVFMDVNDSGIRHILPRLIAEYRRTLEQLEGDTVVLSHSPAIDHLQTLLAHEARHHAALQALVAVEQAV